MSESVWEVGDPFAWSDDCTPDSGGVFWRRSIIQIDPANEMVRYIITDGPLWVDTAISYAADFTFFEENAVPLAGEDVTPESDETPYGYGDDLHKTNAKLHPADVSDIERMLTDAANETAVEAGEVADTRDVTVTFTMSVEQARQFYMDSCKLYHNDFGVIGRLVDAADHISNLVFMALDEMGVKWPDRLFGGDTPYGITEDDDDDDDDDGPGGEDDEDGFGYGFVGV